MYSTSGCKTLYFDYGDVASIVIVSVKVTSRGMETEKSCGETRYPLASEKLILECGENEETEKIFLVLRKEIRRMK